MKYISVFSGIEAASVAWEPLGWEPLAFCEIDEFPSAVLAHRFPDVENLGDITKVDWREFVNEHGRPDVVVGGSPCQSFSVAGGRESLSGESRLMFEYVRALDEIRPRWFLWENVPGVLNTRDNAFAQLLGEVQKLGYGSVAWRVLDAQFFGVAQRRRRVFLVGRLGEGGSAAAVLFEPESVRGDNPTSREKREALARDAGRGPACEGEGSLNAWDVQSKRVFSENGVAPTLSSGTNEGANIQPSVLQSAAFCGYASHTASSIGYQEELSPTLKGNDWQCQVPDVLRATAIRTANTGANGCGISEGCAHTLDRAQPEAVCIQGSMIGRADENGPQGSGVNKDVAFTLNCTDRHAVAFAQNTRDEVRLQGDGTIAGALSAQPGMKQRTYVAEARAYRTNPLPCPLCGADADVTVDDPQEPEQFWHYSCGCSQLGCDNYGRIRRSFGNKEDAIANWNGNVLLCSSIDYKQTPKVNDNLCHTLTHEGDGGIHSAVVYEVGTAGKGALIESDCTDRHAVCFAQNTSDEVRLQGGDGSVAGALGASGSAKGHGVPFVMATGQANAEVTEDMAPTLNCAHEQPIVMDRAAFNQGANAANPTASRGRRL